MPPDARIAEPPADGWTPPRAVPYTTPHDAPVPGGAPDDPNLPYWLALNRVKGLVRLASPMTYATAR